MTFSSFGKRAYPGLGGVRGDLSLKGKCYTSFTQECTMYCYMGLRCWTLIFAMILDVLWGWVGRFPLGVPVHSLFYRLIQNVWTPYGPHKANFLERSGDELPNKTFTDL